MYLLEAAIHNCKLQEPKSHMIQTFVCAVEESEAFITVKDVWKIIEKSSLPLLGVPTKIRSAPLSESMSRNRFSEISVFLVLR